MIVFFFNKLLKLHAFRFIVKLQRDASWLWQFLRLSCFFCFFHLRCNSYTTISILSKCTLQWVLVSSKIVQSSLLVPEHFLHLCKKTHTHAALTPHGPSPQLPATTNLLSVSMDLPILEISYKWNHTTGGLLCLASFTKNDVFKVHLCGSRY